MQAASDIFLGWLREPPGIEDLKLRDLYVRQALGLEDLRRRRRDGALRNDPLREIVRVDARPRSRAVRRCDRDRELPGFL